MYLLDTSAWIEIFRASGKGAKAKEMAGQGRSFTFAISIAELSHWCYSYDQDFDRMLAIVVNGSEAILHSNRIVEKRAGQLRFELNKKVEKDEHPVGIVDCLIMAVAEENGLEIITTDKHFLKFSGRTHLL